MPYCQPIAEEFRRFVTPTAPSFQSNHNWHLSLCTNSVYLRSLSARALNKARSWQPISSESTPHSDIDGKLSSLADRESTSQHLDGAFVFCGNGHVHVAQFGVVSYCGSRLSAHPGKGSLRSHSACPQSA